MLASHSLAIAWLLAVSIGPLPSQTCQGPRATRYPCLSRVYPLRIHPLFWPAEAVDVVFCVAIKQPTPLEIGCDLVTLVLFNTNNALPIIGCAVANVYFRSGAPILKRLM
jgi:hypothetical protein